MQGTRNLSMIPNLFRRELRCESGLLVGFKVKEQGRSLRRVLCLIKQVSPQPNLLSNNLQSTWLTVISDSDDLQLQMVTSPVLCGLRW